jgi:hypothetical protein
LRARWLITVTTPAADAALRSLELDRQAALTVQALKDAGVPSLLLKGPAVARWLYFPGATRPVSDVDLLVPTSHWDTAAEVLRARGMSPRGEAPEYAAMWDPPVAGDLSVDLHRSFHFVAVSPERCWRILHGHAETATLAGEAVTVPSRAALAVLVALHAVADGHGSRTLAELAMAIEQENLATWRAAAELAAELGAVDAFAAGLRAVAGGGVIAGRLLLPSVSRVDIELALEATPYTDGLVRLSRATSWSEFVRSLLRELVPSAAVMRVPRYPFAQAGPAGLAVSYALRPFIVAARFPPAWRAWRRARIRSGLAGTSPTRFRRGWRALVAVELLAAYPRLRRRLERAGIVPAVALARSGAPLMVEDAARIADARRLGRATQRLLAALPGSPSCLTESLVLLRLLSRRGVASRIVLALAPDGKVAHAWVEVVGEPVLPPAGKGLMRLAEL